MVKVRTSDMKQRINNAAARGDIAAIVRDLQRAHSNGVFKRRGGLMGFLKDLIHSAALEIGEGKRSKNMRWSTSTHRVMQVLMRLGGPRSIRLFYANIGGPHLETLRKKWSQSKLRFKMGLHRDTLVSIKGIYIKLMEALHIEAPVPAELSEDETGVKAAITWCAKTNQILGTCGAKGGCHTCCVDEHFLTDYMQFCEFIDGAQLANYITVIMINPLHTKLPALPVLIRATCNRFDAGAAAFSAQTNGFVQKHAW